MNFARQVFISYAHLDNQPLGADQTGWVSLFHTTLQTLLSQRLGASPTSGATTSSTATTTSPTKSSTSLPAPRCSSPS
jgi:hypothetical protein